MNACTSSASRDTLSAHEDDRLESLRSYGVLDTPPEPVYDNLVQMAAALCGVSVAAVALVDEHRLWFKAQLGLPCGEAPRLGTFCDAVVASHAPLVIEDAAQDHRWRLATEMGFRSYAGVPLIGRDGLPLGALCVLDADPRVFPEETVEWLRMLAEQVVSHLELRRTDRRAGLAPTFASTGELRPERVWSALDNGELVPWLQPLVDLRTQSVCGAEALLRWEHPDLGVTPPCSFIPMLEATGLMLPVGRHVLRETLRSARLLYDEGRVRHPFGFSVNVSAMQAAQRGFATMVVDELDRHRLAPELLTVELTETGGPTPLQAIRREMEELREAGVRLEADDFGNGHSTVERLLELPLTGVKLDMSLTSRVIEEPRTARLVRWMAKAAHDLGLEVVGEGVETTAQHDFLRSVGCDRAQGYLFGRAVPLARFHTGLAAVTT